MKKHLCNYTRPTNNWVKAISFFGNHKFDAWKLFGQLDPILLRISHCIYIYLFKEKYNYQNNVVDNLIWITAQ